MDGAEAWLSGPAERPAEEASSTAWSEERDLRGRGVEEAVIRAPPGGAGG